MARGALSLVKGVLVGIGAMALVAGLAACSPESPVGTVFAPTEFECPPDFAEALQADAGEGAVAEVIDAQDFGLAELAEELADGCAVRLTAPGEPVTFCGVIPAKVGVREVLRAAIAAGYSADVINEETQLGQYSKGVKVNEATGEVTGEVLDISLVADALVPGVAENFSGADVTIIYIDLGSA